MTPDLVTEGRLLETELTVPAGPISLRMRRMAGRWLATATGPLGQVELGADRSPYLAAQLALETWAPDAVTVMLAVDRIQPVDDLAVDRQERTPEPAAGR